MLRIKYPLIAITIFTFSNILSAQTNTTLSGNLSVVDDPDTISFLEGSLTVSNNAILGTTYIEKILNVGSNNYTRPYISVGSNNSFYTYYNDLDNSWMTAGGMAIGNNNGFSSPVSMWAVAIGNNNYTGAHGGSFMLGDNNLIDETGSYSIVAGQHNNVWGGPGITLGYYNENNGSIVMGSNNTSGWYSYLAGHSNIVFAMYSIVSGYHNITTSGQELSSILVLGENNIANVSYLTVLGRWNDYSITPSGANGYTWRAEDPLFVLANGSSDEERSNALVVFKSGDTQINGTLKTKRGGDIMMGVYGRAEDQ